MIRKLTGLFVIVTFAVGLLFGGGQARAENQDIEVYVDGIRINFDVPPQTMQNRTMVPFRALAEGIGVKVDWDNGTVVATGKNGEVRLTIDSKIATVGGLQQEMDVAAVSLSGRTLVPLRFFGESLGAGVVWDKGRINISSPVKVMEVYGYYALGDQSTSSWVELFGADYPMAARGNTDFFSGIVLGWYGMDADGNLLYDTRQGFRRPEGYERVLEEARRTGLSVDMMVHMSDGNLEITKLLSDEAALHKACEVIANESESFDGVNIDFEGLGMSQQGQDLSEVKAAFTGFIQKLSRSLEARGKRLTLSLHPLNSNYKGYDYAALSDYAHRIIIMAYDFDQPGQPEPLGQVRTSVDLALGEMKAEKIVLGISSVNENQTSLAAKLNIAKTRDLSGVAFWRLGLIGSEQFNVIENHVVKP